MVNSWSKTVISTWILSRSVVKVVRSLCSCAGGETGPAGTIKTIVFTVECNSIVGRPFKTIFFSHVRGICVQICLSIPPSYWWFLYLRNDFGWILRPHSITDIWNDQIIQRITLVDEHGKPQTMAMAPRLMLPNLQFPNRRNTIKCWLWDTLGSQGRPLLQPRPFCKTIAEFWNHFLESVVQCSSSHF